MSRRLRDVLDRLTRMTTAFALAAAATAATTAEADEPDLSTLAQERADLAPDESLWRQVIRGLGLPDTTTLGYGADEMAFYGRNLHVLRTVGNLFRDVLHVPRFSGLVSERIMLSAERGDLVEAMRWQFLLLDESAAREVTAPAEGTWGVAWLDGGEDGPLSPDRAMTTLMQRIGAPYSAPDREAFDSLPDGVQRLVVRLMLADVRARPWIQRAFDEQAIAAAAQAHIDRDGAGPLTLWTMEDAYAAAVASFAEDGPMRNDTLAPIAESNALVASTDLTSLAYGSLLYTQLAQHAVESFRQWRFDTGWTPAAIPAEFRGVRLETPLGVVRIMPTSDDRIELGREADVRRLAQEGGTTETQGAALLVDLGGDDTYLGRPAATGTAGLLAGGTRLGALVSTVVDLDGADTYDADGSDVAIAAGFFGVAALFDLAGDDVYQGAESSIARALHGTAMLVDYAGDDAYRNDGFYSQAAAHVGAAMLVDLAGADIYETDAFGQGLGGTRGVGAIADLRGNDRYTARDDGNVEDIYWSRSVSMAQGVGVGRRADYGDGESMAGGFGLLLDARGDDQYHASVWSQGAAYWWSAGILEDWSGNDTYRNGWYSLAAAAHFGVGSFVDLRGDDLYNLANNDAVTQPPAVARDGSLAFAIDGAGSDTYQVRSRSLGSGDLGSIAVFWERQGEDDYRVLLDRSDDTVGARALPYRDDPPLGGVTDYPPFRTFRDDMLTVGLFIDSAGRDNYNWPGGVASNASSWDQSRSPVDRGFGLDIGGADEAGEADAD